MQWGWSASDLGGDWSEFCRTGEGKPWAWPLDADQWQDSDDPVTNLVRAGALIVAEIERLTGG